MAQNKPLADELTKFAAEQPETEFAHFLVLNDAGNILVGDAGSASPTTSGYEPTSEVANIFRGDFFNMAKGIATFRGRSSKLSIGAGELRACMLSFENWIVTIRYLAPAAGAQKFLVAINKSPTNFVFGSARRAIDKVTAVVEEKISSGKLM